MTVMVERAAEVGEPDGTGAPLVLDPADAERQALPQADVGGQPCDGVIAGGPARTSGRRR
ncbi:hypothetical protein AB0M94_36180 [Streptomyces xanthochromogenes]|uniref:hypothetical protein n=1 Tax=Streptomyces xanthochromogenes TaxID=67384 RepID=UPI003443CF97